MNNWNSITIKISREAGVAISALLIEAGSAGVEINDSADYLNHEDQFGEVLPEIEQSDFVEITAYYPENMPIVELKAEIEHKIANLSDYFSLTGLSVTTNNLSETNWAEAWKKYFEPARITHDLTIVPSWTEDYVATGSEKLIRLDPGMAFGTGTHPTTKMSLYALEQVLRGGETLLDVGTGSGVLSVAASYLGAAEIFAYDIDEVAVRVALENIELNPGHEKIHVSANNLLEGIDKKADVIVANILADILVLMTEDAFRWSKKKAISLCQELLLTKRTWSLHQQKKLHFSLKHE